MILAKLPQPTDTMLVEQSQQISSNSSIMIDNTANQNNNTAQSSMTNIIRTDSKKSISSDCESYRSTILPSADRNLLITDSSSYASVNDQCISVSASTSSYHTAMTNDTSTSSITAYKTPTPQLDDDILSSHSSISDLSHAETLEPNIDGNLF